MGWIYEGDAPGSHEGYSLGVLASGVIPTWRSSGAGAVYELCFTDGIWEGGREDDPGQVPAWLLPACACAWRGERIDYVPASADRAAREQWYGHIRQIESELAPTAVARAVEDFFGALSAAGEAVADRPIPSLLELHRAETRLGAEIRQAVALVRRQGRSWADIGDALGIHRQTAWERYRDVDTVPSPRPTHGEPL
jgi:hypothetical protein